MPHHPGLLRTAPLPKETTSSLICRIASRYGMEAKVLRACWKWRNYPPGHEGGGARADAEVLLNTAGRDLLAAMCGVEEGVLARALPSYQSRIDSMESSTDRMKVCPVATYVPEISCPRRSPRQMEMSISAPRGRAWQELRP
ncbi:hypothetical protein [Streptomyces beigongshangae]|uniref:hypothetical protein n=1 Tax=Streptomyces beigongshangae TaxID=2841597 RepID=UPI0021A827DC|nr:hypothetical protein [Streptomyces sp. REN17]